MWAWPSIRPGMTVRPLRSSTRVAGAVCAAIAASGPTARIGRRRSRSPAAIEERASMVMTLPFLQDQIGRPGCWSAGARLRAGRRMPGGRSRARSPGGAAPVRNSRRERGAMTASRTVRCKRVPGDSGRPSAVASLAASQCPPKPPQPGNGPVGRNCRENARFGPGGSVGHNYQRPDTLAGSVRPCAAEPGWFRWRYALH